MEPVTTFREFGLWGELYCEYVIETAMRNSAHEAEVVAEGIQSKPDIRSTERYRIDDKEILRQVLEAFDANNVWNFSTHWGEESLPLVEVLHYRTGDFYKPHTDWSPYHSQRKLSMSIQLSDSQQYDGGEVLLYDGPSTWTMTQKQGHATLWPAWTLHEVKPLIDGDRWALVAWQRGPDFC